MYIRYTIFISAHALRAPVTISPGAWYEPSPVWVFFGGVSQWSLCNDGEKNCIVILGMLTVV